MIYYTHHSTACGRRGCFIPFLLLIVLGFNFITASAQISFRDEHGDLLPTPSWPPPASLFAPRTITVWFNHNTINQEYLCQYWGGGLEARKNDRSLEGGGYGYAGCMPVDASVITNSGVLATLQSLGAVMMCQYTQMSPCQDSLSITRWGDTIPTPEFWNSFDITLDSDRAVQAVQILNILYGGTAIDFAELDPVITPDAIPNDPRWILQTHYMNVLHGINMVQAWNIQRGDRHIKVAVVDDGFDYLHPDFGAGIGGNSRFVDGREYYSGQPTHLSRPPTNGGSHGTPVAGFVGAMNNNATDVASIAGGWLPTEGVSLYGMKCTGIATLLSTNLDKDLVDAWIDAAANTTGGTGFAVHVITNSNGSTGFSEERRRALDYAYRLGVVCFSSKGNAGLDEFRAPADYEYSKIVAVGAMSVEKDKQTPTQYDPVRLGSSNWGYGLDIMAPACDVHDPNNNAIVIATNQTLANRPDGTGPVRTMTMTSAATPQVAAVGGLILSEYNPLNPAIHPNIDRPIAPEDVQGLLSITALDMNFATVSNPAGDTTGYDAVTGYGLLKADQALNAMLNPYQLRHFTANGGTDASFVTVDPFIVLAPTQGAALLTPSNVGLTYRAERHLVTKTVTLSGWTLARSWGRGGDGTVGWNGAQPTDPQSNAPAAGRQTGYTRVVGSGNPNGNNVRDICYNNDEITLETYCYKVYNKTTGAFIGWYPTTSDKVVYRYSVWGIRTSSGVEEPAPSTSPGSATIAVRCESRRMLGEQHGLVHYRMDHNGPVTVSIYDQLGHEVGSVNQDLWESGGEQTVSVPMSGRNSGVYIAVVRSASAMGSGCFTLIK